MNNYSDEDIKKFKGKNSSPLKRMDIIKFLTDTFDLPLFKNIVSDNPQNHGQRERNVQKYTDNKQFWQDTFLGYNHLGKRIKLSGFHSMEWVPNTPGLYFSNRAVESRKKAQRYWKSRNQEYIPLGKSMMILGGIGCVRVSGIETDHGYKYLICATSNGIAHQGIPILLNQNLYEKVISSIKYRGYDSVDIEGTIQILPKDKSIIRYEFNIPKFCIVANKIKRVSSKSRSKVNPWVTINLCFSKSSSDKLTKNWTFCSFIPNRNEDNLRSATDWMLDYISRYTDNSKPSILSNFDEHKNHFDNSVEFPINNLKNGNFDIELLKSYANKYHLTIVKDDKLVENNIIPEQNQRGLQWKMMIAENKIEDLIDVLITEYKQSKWIINNLILISSRWNENKTKERLDLLPIEDLRIEKNKIRNSLLGIIDEIK